VSTINDSPTNADGTINVVGGGISFIPSTFVGSLGNIMSFSTLSFGAEPSTNVINLTQTLTNITAQLTVNIEIVDNFKIYNHHLVDNIYGMISTSGSSAEYIKSTINGLFENYAVTDLIPTETWGDVYF